MRKILLLGACALMLAPAACSDSPSEPAQKIVQITIVGTPPTNGNGTNVSSGPTNLTTGSCGFQSSTIQVTGQAVDFASSNTGVVSVDAQGVVRAVGVGTATVTVSLHSDHSVLQTFAFTVTACQATGPTIIPVVVSPATGSGAPGTTLQLSAAQNNTTVTNSCTWTSTNNSFLTVSSTGLVTFVSPGTASATCTLSNGSGSGTYTTNQPAAFVGVTPKNTTVLCGGSVPYQLLDASGNPVQGATWSVTGGGTIGNSTGLYNATTLGGPFTVTSNYNGTSYTTQVSVGGTCPVQNTKPTISPTNPNVTVSMTNGVCSGSFGFSAFLNGNSVTGNWRVTQGSGSFNGSTFNPTAPGQVTIVVNVNGVDSDPLTFTVGGSCTSQTPVSVQLSPSTFSLIVGGGSVTITCQVQGGQQGGSTACQNWAVNQPTAQNAGKTCVQLTVVDATHATLTPLNGCTGTITLTASSVADPTKSGTATGTTSSGNVTCFYTSSAGQQANGDIILTHPGSATLTAACTNQFGATFLPYWYVQPTGIVNVQGSTTVNRGGTNFTAGSTAQLTTIAKGGPVVVTVQAAIEDKTILASHNVTVQ